MFTDTIKFEAFTHACLYCTLDFLILYSIFTNGHENERLQSYHSDNLEQSGVSRTLNVQKVENSDLPPPTARLLSSRHI